MSQLLHLLGYACGIGAEDTGCQDGPAYLEKSPIFREIKESGVAYEWQQFHLDSNLANNKRKLLATDAIADLSQRLAIATEKLASQNNFFATIGGDHTCAIGTWSGVAAARQQQGPVGLLWVDAHMDSHTPQTSPSKNIHGMPVACLLGYGDDSLTKISFAKPKVLPEHLCLVGVRCNEAEEQELLQGLGVKVYFMDEINQRGLTTVMSEAMQRVSSAPGGYGLSICIDSMDPGEAPAVATPESGGIHAQELCQKLAGISRDANLLGFEIAEFNPFLDKNHLTEKVIRDLIMAICE